MPQSIAILQKFDVAIVQRRAKATFISEEQRRVLRKRLVELLAIPISQSALDYLALVRQTLTYLVVAGNFAEFCTIFLGRDEYEVQTLLQERGMLSGAKPAPVQVLPQPHIATAPLNPATNPGGVVSAVVLPPSTARELTPPAAPPSGLPPQLKPVPSPGTVASCHQLTDEDEDFWAALINGSLTKSVEALIKAGCDFRAAKEKLGHGRFESLFESGKIHIDQRSAEMLMRVAENEILSNPSNYSFLPPTIKSLDNLAGVEQVRLQNALVEGKVTARMTIAETQSLALELKPKKRRPAKAPKRSFAEQAPPAAYGEAELNAAYARIAQVLDEAFHQCPDGKWRERLFKKLMAHLRGLGKPV